MPTFKTPQYDTMLFSEVYDNPTTFINDYKTIGLPITISDTSAKTLYLLLYGRYGNNPIANQDVNQWKIKLFSVIFQCGPTWEKRLEIQTKLRNLTDDELMRGSKDIYNNALNPDTAPGTASLEELLYINSQSTTNRKKSYLEAYAGLMALLEKDVTEEFLDKFRYLFALMVRPEKPLLYYDED